MNQWHLNREGFVCHYLFSGPLVSEFTSDVRSKNQLRYEAYLRSIIATHTPVETVSDIRCGEKSRLGMPWVFEGGEDSAFVNLSSFYSVMKRIRFDAATTLVAPCDMTVTAHVWSYAAVDVYLNGEKVGSIAQPMYKPIQRAVIQMPLKQGRNTVYLACETLGVRDTRSVVGLQLCSMQDQIEVSLPDENCAELMQPALAFLDSAQLSCDALTFSSPAPHGTQYTYHAPTYDYALAHIPPVWNDMEGIQVLSLKSGETRVTVRVTTDAASIERIFERTEQIQPLMITPTPAFEENREIIFRRIADVESLNRGGKFGFSISNTLARKYLHDSSRDEERLMNDMLDLIEQRVDCSDFLMCGLTRYLHNYHVEGKTYERIRKVLLGYRYWMDMDGFDGMCFWSENHSLMFYASAMAAGELFPDDHFTLANMSGRELYAWGRSRVLDWLDDVEKHGFEEFLSTVYMCVTFAALINVVDYAEPSISERAAKITDKLLEMLSMHTYKNGIIAPMGRVYRSVLYPFAQGAMALMNLINPALPYEFGEGWLGFYATSKYQIPKHLISLMEQEISTVYTTGNAEITLEKHEDWCMTSVASPRAPFERWKNEALLPDADPSTHSFVKSYNECFHGTTCFEPGTYGYQQHLWYAALDGEASIFVNHPGSASEGGDMRPGYWHGNGVMPSLKQEKNLLGMIYRIPEEFPFHYVHLYAPECRFDEVHFEDGWMFMRKENGYIGFFSSEPMEAWNGMNFNCEQRIYGSDIAALCVCGGREFTSMRSFIQHCKSLNPIYDPQSGKLTAHGFELTYVAGNDKTQYL